MRILIVLLVACHAIGAAAFAGGAAPTPSGLPVPRFVSTNSGETYGRVGPSFEHRVKFTLRRRGEPLMVVAETADHWRKVRDVAGDEMWIHRSKLSGRRTAAVIGDAPVVVRRAEAPDSEARAMLSAGVVVALGRCAERACRVEVDAGDGRITGWVDAGRLWGAAPAN